MYAQTSATHSLSFSQQELRMAERGWSAKKDIMGKAVYNDDNDKIGNVDDVAFPRSSKWEQSFAIVVSHRVKTAEEGTDHAGIFRLAHFSTATKLKQPQPKRKY